MKLKNKYNKFILLLAVSIFTTSTVFASPMQGSLSNIDVNDHVLVIRQGEVYSWGHNSHAQLGSPKDPSSENRKEILKVEGIPDDVIEVQTGHDFSMALTEKGDVYVWGDNTQGTLGVDIGGENISTPTLITGIPKIKQIDASYKHALVLTVDGEVYGWGENDTHQLGPFTGETITSADGVDIPYVKLPKKIEGLSNVVQISAGSSHNLFLNDKGEVYGLGKNLEYQVSGMIPNTDVEIVHKIDGLSNIVQISAGRFHSMALDKKGEVYIWGKNVAGEIGNNSDTHRETILPIKLPLSNIKYVVADNRSRASLALASNGDLFAWGQNGSGEFISDKPEIHTPIKIAENVIEASMSEDNVLILKDDGTLWISGSNKSLQGAEVPNTFNQLNIDDVGNGVHTFMGTRKPIVTVKGTNEATMIKAEVPLKVSFEINPNTDLKEQQFVSPVMEVKNLTYAPLQIELVNFVRISDNSPEIIEDSTYSDKEWDDLGVSKTKTQIALGLKSLDFQSFFVKPEDQQTENILLKDALGFDESLLFELQAKHGLAWESPQDFNYSMTLKLSLNE